MRKWRRAGKIISVAVAGRPCEEAGVLGMETFVGTYGAAAAVGAAGALAAGGFAKGVVGFALPLIGLSLAGAFVPYQVAVALLIVPMLVSNLVQALRQGIGPAWVTLRRFWRLNLVLVVVIALAAQLVVALPDRFLFGLLGVTVSVFGASQLAGWRPRFPSTTGRASRSAWRWWPASSAGSRASGGRRS